MPRARADQYGLFRVEIIARISQIRSHRQIDTSAAMTTAALHALIAEYDADRQHTLYCWIYQLPMLSCMAETTARIDYIDYRHSHGHFIAGGS